MTTPTQRLVACLRRVRLQLQARRVARDIRAAQREVDRLALLINRRNTELLHLQGSALPALSLQYANLQLALRNNLPPWSADISQPTTPLMDLPTNIRHLRRPVAARSTP